MRDVAELNPRPCAILSAEQAKLPKQVNQILTADLRRDLDNLQIPHKKIYGCWKSICEISFLLIPETTSQWKWINRLAIRYNQKAYLTLDEKREVTQINPITQEIKFIGTLVQTSLSDLKKQDNYTYTNSTFYTIKEK